MRCGPKQYYDGPARRCMHCEDICLSVYDTLRQCISQCLDFALEEGYVVRGPITPCHTEKETGLHPLYLLPIMVGVMLVTAIFVLFLDKQFNISARLPFLAQTKQEMVQTEDRAEGEKPETAQLVISGSGV